MKLLDVVAILGALAWTPHIIKLVKDYFSLPKLRIIPERNAEIGFTTYGPIFNLRVAFIVEKKDIVVTGFRINIEHESGDKKVFEWHKIRQQVLRMNTDQGSIPYEKDHNVLAVKVKTSDMEERTIQCQEKSFVRELKTVEEPAVRKLVFETEKEDYDPISFLRSQEVADVLSFIKQTFNWKPGKYNLVFEIESPDKFELIDNEYEFAFFPLDVEQLDKNKLLIKQDHINNFVGEQHDEYKPIQWNWRNPELRKRLTSA